MSDLKIAQEFFEMLKRRGFGVEIRDYDNQLPSQEGFDWNAVIFSLLDSHDKEFIGFDFLGGDFYRISAVDSTGWYGDEVDLRKYT